MRNKIAPLFQSVNQLSMWKSCLLIFLLCFGIRVSLILWKKQYLKVELPEVARIAQSIAQTGVFGNPYAVPTGPTAHSAPFFPFLLSLVYRFFGTGQESELVKEILSTVDCSLQYAMLPIAALCLGWPVRIGIFGGLLGALVPFRFWLETKGSLEQVYVALALMLAVMLTGVAWRTRHYTFSSAIWRGVAWGVAFHVSASLMPVCAALLFVEVVVLERKQVAAHLRYLTSLVLVAILLVLPWTARNYLTFQKLFFMRDNLGLELAVSNNEFAKPLLDDNIKAPKYHHPGSSVAEALEVQRVGEIAYNRERMREAIQWINAHPGRFLELTLLRVRYFWFPNMQRNWQALLYGILTIIGFAGAWQAARRREPAALLIIPLWLTFPLIYYLIESADRYRYPIDWTLLLCAWYLLDRKIVGEDQLGKKLSPVSPSAT